MDPGVWGWGPSSSLWGWVAGREVRLAGEYGLDLASSWARQGRVWVWVVCVGLWEGPLCWGGSFHSLRWGWV